VGIFLRGGKIIFKNRERQFQNVKFWNCNLRFKGDIIWLDFDPQTGHEQKAGGLL
jgi:hypothetical protein